jgi:hypothetical protein
VARIRRTGVEISEREIKIETYIFVSITAMATFTHPNITIDQKAKYAKLNGKLYPWPSDLMAVMDRNEKAGDPFCGVVLGLKAQPSSVRFYDLSIRDNASKEVYSTSFSIVNMSTGGVSSLEQRTKTGSSRYVQKPDVNLTPEQSCFVRKNSQGADVKEDPHAYIVRVAVIAKKFYDLLAAEKNMAGKFLTPSGKSNDSADKYKETFGMSVEIPAGPHGPAKVIEFDAPHVKVELPTVREGERGMSKQSVDANAEFAIKILDARRSRTLAGKKVYEPLLFVDEHGKSHKLTNGNVSQVIRGGTKWSGYIRYGTFFVSDITKCSMQKPSFGEVIVKPGTGAVGVDEDISSQVDPGDDEVVTAGALPAPTTPAPSAGQDSDYIDEPLD